MKAVTWTTRDGQVIPIREMTDSHLVNTIRFLKRGAEQARIQAINDGYAAEAFMQGEQAQYDVQNGISKLENMDAEEFLESEIPQWNRLLNEAKRRGLE